MANSLDTSVSFSAVFAWSFATYPPSSSRRFCSLSATKVTWPIFFAPDVGSPESPRDAFFFRPDRSTPESFFGDVASNVAKAFFSPPPLKEGDFAASTFPPEEKNPRTSRIAAASDEFRASASAATLFPSCSLSRVSSSALRSSRRLNASSVADNRRLSFSSSSCFSSSASLAFSRISKSEAAAAAASRRVVDACGARFGDAGSPFVVVAFRSSPFFGLNPNSFLFLMRETVS